MKRLPVRSGSGFAARAQQAAVVTPNRICPSTGIGRAVKHRCARSTISLGTPYVGAGIPRPSWIHIYLHLERTMAVPTILASYLPRASQRAQIGLPAWAFSALAVAGGSAV